MDENFGVRTTSSDVCGRVKNVLAVPGAKRGSRRVRQGARGGRGAASVREKKAEKKAEKNGGPYRRPTVRAASGVSRNIRYKRPIREIIPERGISVAAD